MKVEVNQTATFECSICGESSTEICVYCAKDSCGNHLCRRCRRCSDCCECEAPLNIEPEAVVVSAGPKPEEPAANGVEELFSAERPGMD